MTIGGAQRMAGGEPIDVVQPTPARAVLGGSAATPPARTRPAAVEAAQAAAPVWRALPFDERAAIFLRAAELLAGAVAGHAQRGHDARPVEVLRTRPRSTRPAS